MRLIPISLILATVAAALASVIGAVGATTVIGPMQWDPREPEPQERLDCGSERFDFVTALRELPGGMPEVLGRGREMAAHDGAFRSTDLVGPGEESFPSRRFSAAAVGKDHIFAAVEQGGIGYSVEYWSFEHRGSQWIGNLRWIGNVPHSLPELLSVTCKEYAHLAAEAVARSPLRFHCIYSPDGLTVFQYEGAGKYGQYELGRKNNPGAVFAHENVTYYATNTEPSADDRAALLAMLQTARMPPARDDSCVPAADRFLKALGVPK